MMIREVLPLCDTCHKPKKVQESNTCPKCELPHSTRYLVQYKSNGKWVTHTESLDHKSAHELSSTFRRIDKKTTWRVAVKI